MIWDELGCDLGISIYRPSDYHMVKLVFLEEKRKQDYHMQQKGIQPEKRMLGIRSKLSLGKIISAMTSLDLAFILLIINWIKMI
jgi:hypothetical protein